MLKLNYKLFLILGVILFMLVIFVAYLSNQNKPVPINNKKLNIPTPTTYNIFPSDDISPTLVHPTFTGVNEEIPQSVLNKSRQMQTLKSKVPVRENTFTVEYDYSKDKFSVFLSEPKEKNRIVFQQWLNDNYQSLSLDKFNIR